jgi:hypothetical protein
MLEVFISGLLLSSSFHLRLLVVISFVIGVVRFLISTCVTIVSSFGVILGSILVVIIMVHAAIVVGDIKIVLRHAVIIAHLIRIVTSIRVIAEHGVHLGIHSIDGIYGILESSRFSVLSFNGRNVETFSGQSAINNFFVKLDGGKLFIQEGSRGFIFTNNTRDLNLRIEFPVDNGVLNVFERIDKSLERVLFFERNILNINFSLEIILLRLNSGDIAILLEDDDIRGIIKSLGRC